MKTILALILASTLCGCQVLGGYIGAHQTAIIAVGAAAGAANQVESATLNGIALKKAAEGK